MPSSDWSFARRPMWLVSHVFALAVVVAFVGLGVWQLDRLDQRQARNALVEERSARAPLAVGAALDQLEPDEVEYVPVLDRGHYVADEQVIVRNRSQGGAAGSWVVTPLRTGSGPTILVNRGFIPEVLVAPGDVAVPTDPVEVAGWLRTSQQRAGFGPRDAEEGRLEALARLDVARIDAQVADDLAPVWLQLSASSPPPPDGLPDPVPLPELGEGNHLSYAVQWFIFAGLGAVVYCLLLRRRAQEAAGERRVDAQLAS